MSTITSGVSLPLRPHQRIVLSADPVGHAYILASGVVMVEGRLPNRQRQILEILYRGAVYENDDTPTLPSRALVAVQAAELQRLRADALDSLIRTSPGLARYIEAARAHRDARRTLHLAGLAGQSSEERLAYFLVDIALYLGRRVGGGCTFDIPFAREEIADYLALNPDTLSRLFSRLKNAGMLSISRGQAVVPEWEALAASCPLSKVMTDLSQRMPTLPPGLG